MARKIENAFTDLKHRMKTCLPSRNPYTPAKTWLARVNRTKTWLTNAKTCLSTKNVPRKGGSFLPRETTQAKAKKRFPSEYASIERKRAIRAKIRLPSENVARKWRKGVLRGKTCLPKEETRLHSSQRRKRVYLAKTCPGKAKKPLPREYIARKREIALPSDDVACKCENGFT